MFPPKTKAAQEFEYCGKPGFVWVLFWERNTCGRMRDSSGGEGGRQHVGNRRGRGAAAEPSCAGACPGRSPRGRRAGWERSAAVRREAASGCLRPTVFMRADSLYCST